jgi:hypothetical protein
MHPPEFRVYAVGVWHASPRPRKRGTLTKPVHGKPRAAETQSSPRQASRLGLWRCLLLLALALAGNPAPAAVLVEEFTTDPAPRGWQIFGDASLFQWNLATGRLEVTWDSSKPNSYFHRRLDYPLCKTDDFSLSFDLRLLDALAGARPEKPGPFEIAIGLLDTRSATNASFVRGRVPQFPNLCEFDYFPQGSNPPPVGVIAATVSLLVSATNGSPAASMTFPMELAAGGWFSVLLNYTASNRTLLATMTLEGQPFGPIKSLILGSSFPDFHLDAVSVSSYSDAGDRYGSVLAHGEVDNLVVTTPDPPAPMLTGAFSDQLWHVQFGGDSRWLYALERTAAFGQWTAVSAWTPGVDGLMDLGETNQAAAPAAFYRVNLRKP